MEEFDCWLPSWEELHERIKDLVKKIRQDRYRPDIVVALSRGGFVPARIICDLMIIKDLVSVKVDHWGITAAKDGRAHLRYPLTADLSGKNVLVVDDITDTGESMVIAKQFVETLDPKETRTATIFHITTSKFTPDYYGKEIDWVWVIWPWNFFEDLSNILPKTLHETHSTTVQEVAKNLKTGFGISLTEGQTTEILNELVARHVVVKEGIGWRKPKNAKA
jgi:hypoxanthine phosphoribosyltransferase